MGAAAGFAIGAPPGGGGGGPPPKPKPGIGGGGGGGGGTGILYFYLAKSKFEESECVRRLEDSWGSQNFVDVNVSS